MLVYSVHNMETRILQDRDGNVSQYKELYLSHGNRMCRNHLRSTGAFPQVMKTLHRHKSTGAFPARETIRGIHMDVSTQGFPRNAYYTSDREVQGQRNNTQYTHGRKY